MTGYYLRVGYNSCHLREDVWDRLKAVVLDLCDHPDRIVSEVQRLQPQTEAVLLAEYAAAYKARADFTIRIHEKDPSRTDPTELDSYISQYASGGGEGREIKEACRRAFCRLVIEALHRECMEVDLAVV